MLRHSNCASNMSQLKKNSNTPTNNTNSNGKGSGNPVDALPKQFVVSMKTLFDILDDQRTGFVRFSDIAKGWQDDGCKGLPHGVLDSLRKVTPASGLLSFDRFCAGLKLCLLRNQNAPANTNIDSSTYSDGNCNNMKLNKSPTKPPRPPSAPLLDIESQLSNATSWNTHASTNTRSVAATHRTLSMPQLSPDSETDVCVYESSPPPPKPPRAAANAAAPSCCRFPTNISNTNTTTTALDKVEIRYALQNWQMGILLNEMDAKEKQNIPYLYNQFQYRGCADGGSSSATDSVNGVVGGLHVKKNNTKRREPRRHTLQNGIDYNMLKRLKQFEEEREVLLLGLKAVDKARDWYLQQLANVQDKIKYVDRMGHVEQWSEVQQERLSFQRARIYEVNRNLTALTESWEHGGFPLHFNLAIGTPNKAVTQRSSNPTNSGSGLLQPVDRLRQQNHHLTNEVNLKSDRIALLEREKQSLLRELFELQQRAGPTGRGPTFVSVLSQSSPSSSGGLGEADVVY